MNPLCTAEARRETILRNRDDPTGIAHQHAAALYAARMSTRTSTPRRTGRLRDHGWVSMQCADCDVKWRGAVDDPCWACGTTGSRMPNASLIDD